MHWTSRAQHTLPLAVLALVALVEILNGRGQVVISLVVIAPLIAATALNRRTTAVYGLLALAVAALLGVLEQQYTTGTILTQVVRLLGVAVGGALAVLAVSLRHRREEQLRSMSAQAATTRAVVKVAEALQRNLLGDPPQVPGLETEVRYLPATRHAEVGGDWYDAFCAPDGTTMLVIGDVAGHDAPAAATMAQTRGMLRGIAHCESGSPAGVLTAMDRAFASLGITTLVTLAVASIDPRQNGNAVLRWSNAGHPAPVLVCADGTLQLLERTPNRLLGVSADAERVDHEVPLTPGDTVVFYTDGLVERRDRALDDGTALLVEELRRIGREPLDRLCDGLLEGLGDRVDDDVALLAVRLPAGQVPGCS
ncbi:MAG TPA: PP2C family protein-serine/threonine phosphatase [Blastococcus sp.]|nr:PP2C family protein-serine/threonine phosphatase [Blastococcus sp.]